MNTTYQCHRVLNIKPEQLIKSFDLIPSPIDLAPKPIQLATRSIAPKDVLHPSVYNLLTKMGRASKLGGLLFEALPYAQKQQVHVDLYSDGLTPFWPALNIVVEGQGVMRWYNPVGLGKVLYLPEAEVYYRSWDMADRGSIVDEWINGKVVIVRTDVPHQTWNQENTRRKVISIRMRHLSWKQWNNIADKLEELVAEKGL